MKYHVRTKFFFYGLSTDEIVIIIYHDFHPTPIGGVVMSSQVKHTHSHQDTPLSPYT